LGINLQIMLPYDPEGKEGCAYMQPDVVVIHEPKEEVPLTVPAKQGYAVTFDAAPAPVAAAPQPVA
jgi:hypothetical protein